MNCKFRFDPCLLMVVGFILVGTGLSLTWFSTSIPDYSTDITGIAILLNSSLDYASAIPVLMMAGLFGLLPVFARKFLVDSEVHASVLTAIAGLISIVLIALLTSEVLDESDIAVNCGVGLYVSILAAVLIMVGGILDVLIMLRIGFFAKLAAPAEVPTAALPDLPVQEPAAAFTEQPAAVSEPVQEEVEEEPEPAIIPSELPTVDKVGERAIHERPRRP